MRLTERFRKGIAIVAIKGDLLDENDEALLQEKINSLTIDGVKKVILDLSLLNLINYQGFQALALAFAKLRRRGGDMRLAYLGNGSQDMFALTKIVKTFPTYESVDRAMANFA
jgi:anti-anti-sigma factor